MPNEPKVTLISWTNDPIQTMFKIWQIAKTRDDLGKIEDDA